MKAKDMLEIEFESRDLGRTFTIREYLCKLLETLWEEGESFSGKRPFGNSGWTYDVFFGLVKAGVVPGEIVTYGDADESWEELDQYDKKKAYGAVFDCIEELRNPSK